MKTILCNKRSRLTKTGPLRTVSVILLGALVAGCPAGKQPAEPSAAASTGGKIVIKGSNTIGEELAPRLIAEFKKDHPAAAFDLEPKATMYGLAALRIGQCDIAAASRVMMKEELEVAQTMGVEMKDYVIGAYSVAVVVNAGNAVTNLTRDQVRDIFIGTIQNWSAVGGPDVPVHLYIRDPVSGTHFGFKELAMENKPYAEHSKLLTNYAAIVQSVANDPGGVGYSSLELAKHAGVKGVPVGGVEPNSTTVHNGQYPYSRVLRLYTNKTKEPPAASEFIQFVVSPHGQEIVAQTGFTPRP